MGTFVLNSRMVQPGNMHLVCVCVCVFFFLGGGGLLARFQSAERLYQERFIAMCHLSHPNFTTVDMRLHVRATFKAYLVVEKVFCELVCCMCPVG